MSSVPIFELLSWPLNDLADVATVIGAPLGLLGLLVGILTLRSAAQASRLQHMHDLFKEYLHLEFEYRQAVGENNAQAHRLRASLGAFKMYTLEEMQLWLQKERGWGWRWLWTPFRRRHVDSWQATIDWHLDHSSVEDFEQLEAAKGCYGDGFLKCAKLSKVRRAARRKEKRRLVISASIAAPSSTVPTQVAPPTGQPI